MMIKHKIKKQRERSPHLERAAGPTTSYCILEKMSAMVARSKSVHSTILPAVDLFHKSCVGQHLKQLIKEPLHSSQKYAIGQNRVVGWPNTARRVCKNDKERTNLHCLDCV